MTNLSPEPEPGFDIAIIGMSGRFAGADNVDALWDLLAAGGRAARAIPDAEFLAAGGDPTSAADPPLVRVASAIDGIEAFDAPFFGYPPAEAALLDPQSRLFLECAHHALEDAAYDPQRFPGAIGLYAGAGVNKYFLFNVLPTLRTNNSTELLSAAFTSTSSAFATRVSYDLGLTGPSLSVQTACSTSLVAVYLACQELLGQRCDIALAGGAALNPAAHRGYHHVPGGPLSPDGHCRTFDAGAAGMFPGDGVGVVVLKRLEEAVADGDNIRAVIRGSAVNNDGRRKVGYTAPSVEGQVEAIVTAHAVADVDPDSISYVEAHGTATPIGDPIELEALTRAFRRSTERVNFCAIGSVKSNLGHTDAAAGVTGLIKTVLALEHEALPPSVDFSAPNPLLDLDHSPFFVQRELAPWEANGTPRRAGVSSFGVGGTNAHVIVEQAPGPAPRDVNEEPGLIVLSAATAPALADAAANLAVHLERHPELALGDVAHTLQIGRRAQTHRLALACETTAAASAALRAAPPATAIAAAPPVVFLFPGWGAQHPAMGRGLYESEPVFRTEIDRCAAAVQRRFGFDLRETLYRDGPTATFAALVATEYALACTLRALGVEPAAMLGNSLGEYAAACVAETFEIEELVVLMVERERLFARVAGGAMLSVPLGAGEVGRWLRDGVSMAAITGTHACTVSGPSTAIGELARDLAATGVACRRLDVTTAAHSSALDPILAEYKACVARTRRRDPVLPYVASTSGTWIRPAEATDADYWRRHARDPVQLAAGLDTISREPGTVLLEIGPGQGLTALAREHLGSGVRAIPTMRHRRVEKPDRAVLLGAIGRLWEFGVAIDWERLGGAGRHRRVSLPGYPFQRERHWIDAAQRPAPQAVEPASPCSAEGWATSALPAGDRRSSGRWAVIGAAATVLAALTEAGGVLVDAPDADDIVVVVSDAVVDLPTLRALAAARREDTHLWVCTHSTLPVTGAERPSPAALRVAEWCRGETAVSQLDFEVPPEPRHLVSTLLAERGRPECVAYRGGRRWRPTLEPVPGPPAAVAADATYVVVDGLEPDTFPFTRRIAEAGAAHVVVSDRSGMPPRAEWTAASTLSADLEHEQTAIAAAAERARVRVPVEVVPAALERDLDRLCAGYAAGYLRALGVVTRTGSEFDVDETAEAARILPAYRRFFAALVATLEHDGILERAGGGQRRFTVDASTDDDVARQHAEIVARHPDFEPDLEVLRRSVAAYPQVLSGALAGTAVLMPGGGLEAVQPVIDNRMKSSDVGAHRSMVAELLASWASRTCGDELRVLEIGGGGGHLTWPVIDALGYRPNLDYCFTDLGRSFVLAAQRRADAAGLGCMSFGVLDVGRDPGAQGYEPASYDLVLAFNVLHATADLRRSVRHAQLLLAPGGVLVVLEAIRPRRYSMMISGLLEGWWGFDDDLREDSPLLDRDGWLALLRDEGFEFVTAHGGEASDEGDHALLLAQLPPGTHGGDARDADLLERIAHVRELEAMGARVSVLASGEPGSLEAAAAVVHVGPPSADGGLERIVAAAQPASVTLISPDDGDAPAAEAASLRAGWSHARWRGGDHADAMRAILAGGLPSSVVVAGASVAAASTEPGTSAPAAFNRRPALTTPYREPAGDIEPRVALAWQAVLGIEGIGADDNFFDLGGESLLAMRLAGQLHDAFAIEVPMAQLFETPTVRGVAAAIAAARVLDPAPVTPLGPSANGARAARRDADGRIVAVAAPQRDE